MLSALLVLLGFFAGVLGAMTGIGGGVLLSPILALHFGIPIRQAIGTSLVAVITTSAASSSVHLQRHTTDIRLGMTLELATSLGAAVTALPLPEPIVDALPAQAKEPGNRRLAYARRKHLLGLLTARLPVGRLPRRRSFGRHGLYNIQLVGFFHYGLCEILGGVRDR